MLILKYFNLRFNPKYLCYTAMMGCLCLSFSESMAKPQKKHKYLASLINDSTNHFSKLYDTLRILKHPQGQREALTYLDALSYSTLNSFKGEHLFTGLEKVVCIEQSTEITPQQLWNILKTIKIFGKLGEVRSCMAQIWLRPLQTQAQSARKIYGDSHREIITRAVALLARQTHRIDLLQGLSRSPDPIVRVHVAYSGAEPNQLCHLLKDPWPEVQRAAIIGIEKVSASSGLCLLDHLKRLNDKLKERAIRTLGRLGQSEWAQTSPKRDHLYTVLTQFLSHRQNKLKLRKAALVALANWNDLSASRTMIKEHLHSGLLEELTLAALQALNVSKPNDFFSILCTLFNKSSVTRVRLHALSYLERYPLMIKESLHHDSFDLDRSKQVLDYLNKVIQDPNQYHIHQGSQLYQRLLNTSARLKKGFTEQIQATALETELMVEKQVINGQVLDEEN